MISDTAKQFVKGIASLPAAMQINLLADLLRDLRDVASPEAIAVLRTALDALVAKRK